MSECNYNEYFEFAHKNQNAIKEEIVNKEYFEAEEEIVKDEISRLPKILPSHENQSFARLESSHYNIERLELLCEMVSVKVIMSSKDVLSYNSTAVRKLEDALFKRKNNKRRNTRIVRKVQSENKILRRSPRIKRQHPRTYF